MSPEDDEPIGTVLVPRRRYAVGWITISVVEAPWIVGAIFLAVLAVVVFSVLRGLWRISRGDPELEAGGSWGRQLFGGRRRTCSDLGVGQRSGMSPDEERVGAEIVGEFVTRSISDKLRCSLACLAASSAYLRSRRRSLS
jgi:hypothetical protein